MASPEFTIEELVNEEWRDVKGYEGVYSVSNLGRVRRDIPGTGTYIGKILKPTPDRRGRGTGYLSVMLSVKAKTRRFTVHKLVAEAFLGPRPAGHSVNHKDASNPETMTKNNRADNLEYLTPQGQMNHAKKHGLTASGDKNGSRKHPEKLQRGEKHYLRRYPEKILRGEKHPNSIFTDNEVAQIKIDLTNYSVAEVAKRWNKKYATIYAIATHANWK